ncbi:MAG: hypothetical protein ACRDD7_07870 [Peptostreptococcaceae bacterium]
MELMYYNAHPAWGALLVYATKEQACDERGTLVGQLYHKEACVYVDMYTNGWGARAAKIEFMNSSGAWTTGWITFNGSRLESYASNPEHTVNGNPRYIVTASTGIYDGNKNLVTTLSRGDYIYSRPGPAYVGASEHDWIRCFAYKKNGNYYEPGKTLFADTKVKHKSSNPQAIKGGWD